MGVRACVCVCVCMCALAERICVASAMRVPIRRKS